MSVVNVPSAHPVMSTLGVLLFLSFAGVVHAANLNSSDAEVDVLGISLELAQEAARASIEECSRQNSRIGVSVVDSAGVLKVLLAADGTTPRGVYSSTDKARTALAFGIPTSSLHKQIDSDKVLAAKVAENPAYNSRPGGVLVIAGEKILGAIGVGGAKIDEECALAGLEKIKSRL